MYYYYNVLIFVGVLMGVTFNKFDTCVSDNELVTSIKRGEYELFHTLIKRYKPFIEHNAKLFATNGAELEDLIQEGNIALFSAVESFKATRAKFSTFAARCIKNSMIDFVRKSNAKHKIPDNLFSSIDEVKIEDTNTPEKIFFEKEDYKLLTKRIAISLSPLEYRVLNLYLQGLSYEDISKKLCLSPKSVDNSLRRIRVKLKSKRL